MGRVAVFIDGAYLDYVLRDEFAKARIDYGGLSERLAGAVDLLRTYYYHCLPYQSPTPTVDEAQRIRASSCISCTGPSILLTGSCGTPPMRGPLWRRS